MPKMKYKISSRATILLGRESVSRVDGAIIELIKNTYDADATICILAFDIPNDIVYIFDNGIGMTQNTIENHWMLIGTDNKRTDYESNRNRIKSGEKGIGRFALDRLGRKCIMHTKSSLEDYMIKWETDWDLFEASGLTLDQIEADFSYLDATLDEILPQKMIDSIESVKLRLSEDDNHLDINLDTGTLLTIKGLRDQWSEKEINGIINSLGFLMPPSEQSDYFLCVMPSFDRKAVIIDHEIEQEFDYQIKAIFDGNKFDITINRNEFNLEIMPKELFERTAFSSKPYRYEDFKQQIFSKPYSVQELTKNVDEEYVKKVKALGHFEFSYIFMKLSIPNKERYYYKSISNKRSNWLEQHGGIKIYRDHFLVRPYGDPSSDSFDWLSLDARQSQNPVAVSDKSEKWAVRNAQSQGTVLISRIDNSCILDKSSREGIIENEYFQILKNILKSIISVFERDRAYIARNIKLYVDEINEKEKVKSEGKQLAKEILRNKKRSNQPNIAQDNKPLNAAEQAKMLAQAVQYYEEEKEELISEIKSLRIYATNGLITTSIVHDLKGINAQLITRVESFEHAINSNNIELINRNLKDLAKNDTYLKSWITVITNQVRKDRRTRKKKNMYNVIKDIIDVIEPILTQKKINIEIIADDKTFAKRIFVSDFESILYNLIMNSIEAFEKTDISDRQILVHLELTDHFIIRYSDNGKGIDTNAFTNPNEIFKFGATNKIDKDGNPTGSGLGMYIVDSTLREYNADYTLKINKPGFHLDLVFPT